MARPLIIPDSLAGFGLPDGYGVIRWTTTHDQTDIVSALDCKSYEIDGQGNIDALFLWSTLRVSKLPLYHCSPATAQQGTQD